MIVKILIGMLSFIDSLLFFLKKYEISKSKCDVLFIQHSNNYGYIFNGKKYAHLTYSAYFFLRTNVEKVAFLDKPFSKNNKEESYYPSINVNVLFFFEVISNFILKKILSKEDVVEIRKSRRFNIWSNIIRLLNPKVIIGIQPESVLCFVAKKNKIKIYDLQHGVINKDHYWYGREMNETLLDDELPTGILFWDQESANNIKYWMKNRKIESVVVGNPWLNRFLAHDNTDVLVVDARNELNFLKKNKPVILVTLQWGLEDKCYDNPSYNYNGVMCKALEQAIIHTAHRYNWLLRLHPVQMNGKNSDKIKIYLRNTFGQYENVEWEKTSYSALPALLSRIDLHITDISTVVNEATYFGIKSALLNLFLNKGQKYESYFKYERECGFADIVEQNIEQIESWVERSLRASLEPNAEVFLVNTKDEFEKLLRD